MSSGETTAPKSREAAGDLYPQVEALDSEASLSLRECLAQKTLECEEYAKRVEELEQEVLLLQRERESREQLGSLDSSLHKDEVLQKLCDIVVLAEAMWRKLKRLQLQEVLRAKALTRLYEAEGVAPIATRQQEEEEEEDDPLVPLAELNMELRGVSADVQEVRNTDICIIYLCITYICI